jgi:predicted TPR repeat methyltransferase
MIIMVSNWQERHFHLAHWIDKLHPEDNVTVFKSGAESASLVESDEYAWISYNGHPRLQFWEHGLINTPEMLSGIIPALSSPEHDRAVVIGFGTGITAGTAAKIFKFTDVVEINDAFYKMMPHLKHINFDIEHNPSAKLHLTDGRAFLVGKEGVYDAVINSVSAPTYFSASKIYTVEFYERAAKALKPGGVFCLWLRAAEMSEQGILTILSALRHNFRYCELRVMKQSYYMATCYNQPIQTRRFSEMPVHQDLMEQLKTNLVGFDIDEFFEDILVSKNLFKDFSVNLPQENTDDHPVLEFLVVRAHQLQQNLTDPFLSQQGLFNINPIRSNEMLDSSRLARRAGAFWVIGSGFFDRNFIPFIGSDLNARVEFLLWGSGYFVARGQYEDAASTLRSVLRTKPDSAQAHYQLGTLLELEGKFREAAGHYRQALKIQPDFSDASNRLEKLLQSQGKSGSKSN